MYAVDFYFSWISEILYYCTCNTCNCLIAHFIKEKHLSNECILFNCKLNVWHNPISPLKFCPILIRDLQYDRLIQQKICFEHCVINIGHSDEHLEHCPVLLPPSSIQNLKRITLILARLPPFCWFLYLTCCADAFFDSSHFRLAGWFLDFLLVVVTAGRGLCRTLGPQWDGRPLGSFLTSSLTGREPINLSTIFEPWDFCNFLDFFPSVDSVGDFFSFAFFKDSKRACNNVFPLNQILFLFSLKISFEVFFIFK